MNIPIISWMWATLASTISIYWELPQMLMDALTQTSEENAVIIIALIIIMMVALYTITFLIIWLVIIDNIFPHLEIRDSLKNRIKVARILFGTREGKFCLLRNADTVHTKTPGLFPLWETLPVYIGGPGDNEQRFRWFRIYTIQNKQLKNIVWNEDEHRFRAQYEPLGMDAETLEEYLKDARKELKAVSHGVTQGIKGDFGLQKEKYTLQAVPYHLEEDEEKPVDKPLETPVEEPREEEHPLEDPEPMGIPLMEKTGEQMEKLPIEIPYDDYMKLPLEKKMEYHQKYRVIIGSPQET